MQFLNTFLFCYILFCSYLNQISEAIANENINKIPEGTLKLIIKTYIEDLLESADVIDEIIKAKLLSLGDHIVSHPALHQSYRNHFHVGPEPPNFEPDQNIYHENVDDKTNSLVKRQRPNFSSEEESKSSNQVTPDEICKTKRQWEQINTTYDYNDNLVDVVHEKGLQQNVFTYRCGEVKNSCTGVQTEHYKSECAERNGWVYMLHRKRGETDKKWGYVSIPHHCTCKLIKVFPTTIAIENRKRSII